jgi:5'-nucleotidase
VEKNLPPDVDLLKIDVPDDATPQTEWQLTRLARQRYYDPIAPQRESWSVPAQVGYKEAAILEPEASDSDVAVIRQKRLVSLTPLSLDLTSRADFEAIASILKG